MTYSQVLEHMYRQLPMYQRVGSTAFKKNLDNVIALCDALDNPEKKFKSIHIAGTNGKGSVSHMLTSVFQSAGYKTGLYTSPHLKDFRERIKIDGRMISKHRVTSFYHRYEKLFKKIKPSFFEMTVAMAFDYFAKKKVDIAIIETGLGGRLDSTNIINPELSIITNISKDHTQMLGNTLKQIAKEKAGIIKKNTPVVLGAYNTEYYSVIANKCKHQKAPLHVAPKKFKFIDSKIQKNGQHQLVSFNKTNKSKPIKVELDLIGSYQQENVRTVLQVIEVLKADYSLNDKNVLTGLKNTIKNTGLLARWQIINNKPITIIDTGHNEAAIKTITNQLKQMSFKKLHIVFGVVDDKKLNGILSLLPKSAQYYFCKANVPRGLDAELLKTKAKKFQLSGNVYSSVKKAANAALKEANAKDLIFIGGSAFVCAEII
ncbi:MAG: bifunctional folylpolyglutamate synthase/dihydrofolate synthase [Bacteroidia bacterium]|nr:bifunctional folylpolyglutamate synthase/dihydrofolate synthase [Bacteroidia bacterium]NNC86817.1 bifunctional folylpolyglutamate synthase/dihydrofolate synthase [Bacteroidia bacterium]NNM16459.1 bifunctional folylpolyglutamate synthase/dihydrofolate synthase [Bacteroidia bacterium]